MFVFCAGPTSPAYSCGPGVRTEPGCFADRSFSTQAYKPRVLTDITRLRVAVPKTSFFCCLHLSSIRVSRSFPHRLADVRISVSTSFVRCYGVARGVPEDGSGRGLPSTAFRPLDPTLIAQCFPPIGRRPVACSAIVLRLALREGRPISRARLLFYPAIRVDSPTSPAVACSVHRQLSLHVGRREPRYESERAALHGHRVIAAPPLVFETTREVTGARAHLSPILSLAVLSDGWFTCHFSSEIIIFLMFVPTQSPAYSPSSPAYSCVAAS